MLIKAKEENRTEIMNYCLEEPSINLFIIGDIENFGFETDFQEVWMQRKEDAISAIVLRYHENFIIYSKDLDFDIEEITELLIQRNANIISGKLSVLDKLYPKLSDIYNKKEMHFCELKDNSKLDHSFDEITIAKEEDAMEIAEAYGNIKEFSTMYSNDIKERYKQINGRITSKEGIHMFIKKEDKIIAHGNTTAETSVCGMIGGIFTIPEYRGQGFANGIISALGNSLISRGKTACLFFDNVDAGRIYYKLGFKDIDKWSMLYKK